MKRSRALTLVLVAQTPLLLAGCDQPAPDEMTRKGFYTDIAACEKDGNAADVCQRALANATQANAANAPKYKTKQECIAEFGDLCAEREHESGFWSPLMTGFLLSQLLSPGRGVSYLDASPIYRTRTGQFTQYVPDDRLGGGNFTSYGSPGGGSSGGAYRSVDIAPNRAVTVSRSGFGSVAAARSGWGGKSSGSSTSSSGS